MRIRLSGAGLRLLGVYCRLPDRDLLLPNGARTGHQRSHAAQRQQRDDERKEHYLDGLAHDPMLTDRLAATAFRALAFALVAAVSGCEQGELPGRRPDVPFEPTPHHAVAEMLRLAQVGAADVVYDLGCGDGRIVIAAAKDHAARAVCIDIDPRRIRESRANAERAGVAGRITFLTQDFFQSELAEATVVTLFLWPDVNQKLCSKLWRELKPGARIVSYVHSMGYWKPLQQVNVEAAYGPRKVFLWVIPAERTASSPCDARVSARDSVNRPLLAATAIAIAFAGKVSASVVVPLSSQTNWQILQYSNLPPHRVGFSAQGLEMAVDGSAMPLIYPLAKPIRVKSIRVKGRLEGALRLPPERQGERKFDDYALRVGLVEPGERTLNFVQRQLAAPWVRKLFELAPKGSGISRIHFFNVGTAKGQIGRQRQHPLSDLILERVVAVPAADGRFDFVHALDKPLDAIAVWLSSDGDDTGSRFTVLVQEIELLP
jgi:SAM-dependent methyltransferase